MADKRTVPAPPLTFSLWHTASIHVVMLLAAKRKLRVTTITISYPYLFVAAIQFSQNSESKWCFVYDNSAIVHNHLFSSNKRIKTIKRYD